MKKNEFNPVAENNSPFTNEEYTANENTAVAPVSMDDNNHFIADLTSRQTTFCSLIATTPAEKAMLFKAMNNPEKRVGDCINMTINAKDLFCEVVNCINQQTGEVQVCPRIVIIDDKGVGYQAVSLGVYSAIKKIIQVFGAPSWKPRYRLLLSRLLKATANF